MPLMRYQIRNEYGLADPELYKAADRDDPEALLEGVAMAGLVGVLRQLGDLAEFAAEIFHDLHEEVMATATRGHGLVVRVQQLEADFPSIEKALLSQTNHSSFYSNAGADWHPNMRSEQNLITRGDLPRFVMDSYEECRGPPRLFLLDKFDVAGAGACLKRYTDPSFFKVESATSLASVDMQRDRKIRKVKKKGSRWRNGGTPDILLTSHAKLHELFLVERIENGYSDPARRVRLKKRHLNGSAVDSKTRTSYMDKFVENHSPERKLVCSTSATSPLVYMSSDNDNESGLRILDISTVSPAQKSPERSSASSSTYDREELKQSTDGLNGVAFYEEIMKGSEPNSDGENDNCYPNLQMVTVEKELEDDEDDSTEGSEEEYISNDMASEVDNYVDAFTTMESEQDTDNEGRPKSDISLMKVDKCRADTDANEEEHVEVEARSLDSRSNENSSMSDDSNNSFERDKARLHSDTLSNLIESTPSECNAAAKEFLSSEASGAEDTCIEDGGEISCNRLVRALSPKHSSMASYDGPELDETSSGKVKFGSESLATKENGTNLDHVMAVGPDDSSPAKDEFKNSSLTHPQDESDEEDLCATSDDFPHPTNVEGMASISSSGNESVNEVFETQCAAKTEEQISSDTTLLPHNSVIAELDDRRVDEVDDFAKPTAFKSGVLPWRRISRESYPEEVASQTHDRIEQKQAPETRGLMDKQISDDENFNIEEKSRTVDDEETSLFTNDAAAEEGDSAYVDHPSNSPTYSSQGDHVLSTSKVPDKLLLEDLAVFPATVANSDDVNDLIDTSTGTSSVDAEEGDSVSVDIPSESPTCLGHGNHEISDNIVPETAHVEDATVSSIAAKDDGIDDVDTYPDATCSPPVNCMNLHESLPEFRDSHPKESELDGVGPPKLVAVSEMQKEEFRIEVVSPDSESNPGRSVAYDVSNSEVLDDEHNFSLDEQSGKSLNVSDVPTVSQSLDQSHQEYAFSSSTSGLPKPETSLEDVVEKQANHVHMDYLEGDGASDPLEAAIEGSLEFQPDQLGGECLQDDQASTNSLKFQSAQIGSPNHMDEERSKLTSMGHINQEVCLDTNSESFPGNLPSQSFEFLSESASPGTVTLKQTLEPLESVLPTFFQPPVVNIEGTPPLPPLPPMQWRLGKIQHSFVTSDEELSGVDHDSLSSMQSLKTEEIAQIDLPAPQRELLQPQNPFLSVASEDMKFQHVVEPLVGHEVHPSPYLQSVDQDNFPALGGPAFSSPLTELSKVSIDSYENNEIGLEGQKGLYRSKSFTVPDTDCPTSRRDPEMSLREAIHPQQLMPETGLDPEVLHYSFNDSELEQAGAIATSVTSPTMEEKVQPHHSLSTSEEEKVQSSLKPLTISGTEGTTSRHDTSFSNGEVIQPQQRLQHESALEPEDSLRNLEREQEKSLVKLTTAMIMVDENPQLSFPTSEGETGRSSSTPNVMPDSEVGMCNGTVNKIPRPRNPLIDAVTAHGQSKLKKVSERIQPPIEPKEDERDLFLQQIRTKSFNLKPATVTRSTPRPNIQGHNPNLKVMSLLEKKAIAIRQAFAGSDEDDDDSWSDS